MRYKLKMNDTCVNCGLCTGNVYISDESNGLPYVQKSIILEEEREAVQKLVETCPVQALSLCELKKKSLEVCRREIADMIANFNLSVPPEKDFCYDKKGSIIFFVGLTLPRYRFSKPSASLDMNLR